MKFKVKVSKNIPRPGAFSAYKKNMGMVRKEIFRFQCGTAVEAAGVSGGGAHHSKTKSTPAIAGRAQ